MILSRSEMECLTHLKKSKTNIQPTFPCISVLPESARLYIPGQGISGVFGRDRNGPISGVSGISGNSKLTSNPHAACDARFQGIEMNQINNNDNNNLSDGECMQNKTFVKSSRELGKDYYSTSLNQLNP